jgi:hypothetical protein
VSRCDLEDSGENRSRQLTDRQIVLPKQSLPSILSEPVRNGNARLAKILLPQEVLVPSDELDPSDLVLRVDREVKRAFERREGRVETFLHVRSAVSSWGEGDGDETGERTRKRARERLPTMSWVQVTD